MLFNISTMKLNLINKIYIVTAILILLATVFRIIKHKGWERYNYSTVISAPESYPVYFRQAYFLLPDGDYGNIGDEEVNRFTTSWASEYSSADHAQSKRLPAKLVLEFVSYRDKKFYKDTLSLPESEMKAIFASADKNRQFLKLSSYGGDKWGLSFAIGIANAGNVIVWLRGVNLEKVLLKVKLPAIAPQAADLYFARRLTRDEYFKKAFENLSDSVKTLLDGGFDAKANYIDTPSRYLENNRELWEYQRKNGFIP